MQKTMWGKVLTKLEKRINRPSFNTWLRPTCFLSQEQHSVHIGVPNEVFVYWLGEHYVNVISEALAEVLGFEPAISFVVVEAAALSELDTLTDIRQSSLNQSASPQPDVPQKMDDLPVAQGTRNGAQRGRPLGQLEKPTYSVRHLASEQSARSAAKMRPAYDTEAQKQILLAENGVRYAQPDKALASGTVSAAQPRLQQPAAAVSQGRMPAKQTNTVERHTIQRTYSETPPQTKTPQEDGKGSLNTGYTFDTYVVGSSNRFAHAAALAVAEQIAENYNPLFIYGGVGLGKTHLLHAIGNYWLGTRPQSNVLYLSSEQFINEMVTSIRGDRMTWFREKYRNIDLLLVDDIQFIARKERTQEEFFHTFNTLYQARKQIVLTSDCPPKKIPTIAEQLRSRFEWGLIADIQPPDLETRIAILKKKADQQQLGLPDEVALYIAGNVKSNIRELEGCLSKIRAYAMFQNHEVTLTLAQKVLHDMFDAPATRKITVDLVQQIVANHYQIDPASMKSSARSRKITLPRQIAMYLARELTNLSLPDIGRNFGGRDHTTVMHACKKIEKNQTQDTTFREQLIQIREIIQA